MSIVGFFLVDKGPGLTSHSVVSKVSKVFRGTKVGHLGTLDPFATGLLPILVGGATRLSDEVMDGKKGYLFDIHLGIETDTLDPSGQTIKVADVPADFAVRAMDALNQFRGKIEQIPPVYSALKMNGRPLYEHMRATGKLPFDIIEKKREVTLHELDLVAAEERDGVSTLTIRACCSKGTYVRSLARDLALAIGTVGHCSRLRREFVEPWSVQNAFFVGKDTVLTQEELLLKLQPVESLIPEVPCALVPLEFQKAFQAGNIFDAPLVHFPQAMDWLRGEAKVMFTSQESKFLCDVSSLVQDENLMRVHPRKKIF